MSTTSLILTSCCVLVGLALIDRGRRRRNESRRIRRILGSDPIPSRRSAPSTEARMRRMLTGVGLGARPLTPRHYRARVEDRLSRAGALHSLSADEFVVAQLFGAVAGGGLALAFAHLGVLPGRLAWLVVGAGAGAATPWALLERRIRARSASIVRRMPDFLDLMTLSVEAGVAFDGALQEVAAQIEGPLGEEMQRVLADISLGRSRREALDALDGRLDLHEVSAFVLAVTQGLELGAPIGRVLRAQAAGARLRHRQAEQERMNRLPVKILIPTVLLILPPTLIVVLGPSLSSIGAMFG